MSATASASTPIEAANASIDPCSDRRSARNSSIASAGATSQGLGKRETPVDDLGPVDASPGKPTLGRCAGQRVVRGHVGIGNAEEAQRERGDDAGAVLPAAQWNASGAFDEVAISWSTALTASARSAVISR